MLAITGLGMMTALGFGAVGTLAALRADVSRPRALRTFLVDDGVGGEEAATGHPVTGYAEGFTGPGAWVRLALGAFADLAHGAGLPPATAEDFWCRTGLTLLGPTADVARFPALLAEAPDAWTRLYARPVVEALRLPLARESLLVLGLGHGALAEALQRAGEEVFSRRVDRVLVLAADSFLDAESLAWLHREGRLKCATCPMGTQPGEAGAALLVEAESIARGRRAPQGGRVRAVALDETVEASPVALGRALAEAVRRVLPQALRPFRGDVLLDLNGEAWRAKAWGHAQPHLTRELLDFEHCRLNVPAECLGELGVVSAPLAVGVAVGAHLHGHNPEGAALVLSLCETGRVAAVHLGLAPAHHATPRGA
jgi:3-oxoacyl-[acyl-carrier-protein] synthase-1